MFFKVMARSLWPRFLRVLASKLSVAFTPIDDQWTWVTKDGKVFEDVEVESVEGEAVIFRHREGLSRLCISDLNPGSRLKYERGLASAHELVSRSSTPRSRAALSKTSTLRDKID